MSHWPIYTQISWTETYSEIVDVRSPSEFAEDHIPGAINLPVLNDRERAEVGILYKQVNPFSARKLGAALVAQNIAQHLRSHFADKEKDYQPLLYCWRGGQRSVSMAIILTEIGWRVSVLQGGYKAYRAYVSSQLTQVPQQFTYRVLCGPTGSGKTHLLRQIAQQGGQVLDLEALANHRGSLLGQEWRSRSHGNNRDLTSGDRIQLMGQPSQKYFESLLLKHLQFLDPRKPVWVESESNKIGRLYLPPALWQVLKQASCIAIEVPRRQRIQWLLTDYPHLIADPELLKTKLEPLKVRYGREQLQHWHQLIDQGAWSTLVENLLLIHYDPAYQRSLHQCYSQMDRAVALTDLSPASIAEAIATLLGQ